MRDKPVTIYDIARRLDISPSTVSRGLRDDQRINERTKALIAQTAEALNYRPNRVAAGLRGGRTGTIGVLVPRIERQFFAGAISGIEAVARRRGVQVIITQSRERAATEVENVAALSAARVDGIIASISAETVDVGHFRDLIKRQVPLVFFDRVSADLAANQVVLNDEEAARQAVNHLLEGGAARIAHLGGAPALNIYTNRYNGYRTALRSAGIEVDDALVRMHCLSEAAGYRAGKQMLASGNPPEAFFCASDFSALGLVKYCKEAGIEIPERVAIVSFANEPFTSLMDPPLSSVNQNSEQMGLAAADLLFKQIDSGDKRLPPEKIVVPGELIVRASSRR